MFVYDLKVFLSSLDEVKEVYQSIERFEAVSGLLMHRDSSRNKCQALPFGDHRNYQDWPDWLV